MRKVILIVYFLSLIFSLAAQESLKDPDRKTYVAKSVDHQTGKASYTLADSIWSTANVLEDFSQPWSNTHLPKTKFRALHNNSFLFLRYDVEDDNILIYKEVGDKMNVVQSDRVEIFFRKNRKMNTYYCLEVDPNGRVLDYAATFYRKFDNGWVWPQGHLITAGKRDSGGYKVCITISLKSLRDLGLLRKNSIEAGIYRGDCKALPGKDQKDAEIRWISWIDPKTESPDFHVPSSFGKLLLE